MIYTVDGEWLVCNGEKVLYCEGYTQEQMEELRAKYQADADVPKVDIDFDKDIKNSAQLNTWLGVFFREGGVIYRYKRQQA
jgi:hypothetical protein